MEEPLAALWGRRAPAVGHIRRCCSIGSLIRRVDSGFLHSMRAMGMPFTNSTSSGTMHLRPWVPGMSTRNCETTVNSLRSGFSQLMYRTRWSRPPSQSGSPSMVKPPRRSSVAFWLASRSAGVATLVRALTAWLTRRSSSHGLPSGPLLMALIWRLRRSSRKTSLKFVRPDLLGSVGAGVPGFAPARWVRPSWAS